MSFTLYRDEETARKSTFNPTARFLLMFDQSVRGLAVRAPVEFRGITLGRVADISFDLAPGNDDRRVPVLIEIDPLLMRSESRREAGGSGEEFVREAVANGMRAGLRTGSLITGALFVDLDYYPDAPAAEMVKTGEFWQIPTVSSGLAQLEAKVTAILDKIQAMPLEKTMADVAAAAEEAKTTVAEARKTLQEIEATAAAARATLEDPAFRELPADLRQSIAELGKSVASLGPDGAMQGDLLRTLDELRASLRSFKAVTTTIDEKPNSLLFGRESSGNPKPKAPR
jgi:paraquat-inducible protein B